MRFPQKRNSADLQNILEPCVIDQPWSPLGYSQDNNRLNSEGLLESEVMVSRSTIIAVLALVADSDSSNHHVFMSSLILCHTDQVKEWVGIPFPPC